MQRDGGPGGAGGAGNPTGGSFTGPAQALEIVGDHAYAYSGIINDNGTGAANATMFSFTSGNYYTVASLDLLTDAKAGENVFVEMTLNGAVVYKGVWDDTPAKANARPLVTFIIPSYTEVVFKWGCSSNKNATAVITARIYR